MSSIYILTQVSRMVKWHGHIWKLGNKLKPIDRFQTLNDRCSFSIPSNSQVTHDFFFFFFCQIIGKEIGLCTSFSHARAFSLIPKLLNPCPTFIKPDQRNPWIKDQLGNDLLSTILHLQLPNFVSCGRDKPSHMTQNLVTVGAKL